MTISKLADKDNNNTPLKGETPPTGRRAQAGQLLRRMTKMNKVRGLKNEGKDWIKERIRAARNKDDDSTSSSDSDDEKGKKRGEEGKDEADNVRFDETASTPKKTGKYVYPVLFLKTHSYQGRFKLLLMLISLCRKRTKRSAYLSNNSHTNALEGLQGSSKLWIGKDYTNFIVKDFADLESPFTGKLKLKGSTRIKSLVHDSLQ